MTDTKTELLHQLTKQIETELATLQKSVDAAAEAATHPESKPENKYDTRGLEASYLAGAQKERVAELKGALMLMKSVVLKSFTADDRIVPTALIELELEGHSSLCFLMAWGAGYALEWQGRPVLTITPQSPLGQALLGKVQGDAVQVKLAQGRKDYEVIGVS